MDPTSEVEKICSCGHLRDEEHDMLGYGLCLVEGCPCDKFEAVER